MLGTGKIARKFADALRGLPEAELLAVGSRAEASARAFAEAYGVPRPYGSYEALAADPEVDVVYVGTPHVQHAENSLLALGSGKAVLCEKPFALNVREARAVVAAARERGLFLMEAMWTRFLPLMDRLRVLLEEGALGEVRLLAADFGIRMDAGPEHRIRNPALGGGALLDLGVYPVSLASMLWGRPERVAGAAHLGETGVDEQGALVLDYGAGRMAVLYTSLLVDTPVEAHVMGTRGRIRLHHRWHHPTRLTLSRAGAEDRTIEVPYEGNGLGYEAAEVMRCLRAGERESPRMPLEETLQIMETLDRIRAQWGLVYPGE